MDASLLEIFASEIYNQCFKTVIKADKQVGGVEKNALNQCFNRYYESYKVVAPAFTHYIVSQPSPRDFGASDD